MTVGTTDTFLKHDPRLPPLTSPSPCPCPGITRESPSKGYFPFGYSTRSCIGATLALIEGTVMITLLAQRYTFKEVCKVNCLFLPLVLSASVSWPRQASPRHEPHHSTTPQDPSFKLRLKSGITMVSENGVKVRVERDTEYATMKV